MGRRPFQPNRWRRRYNYICLRCEKKRTTLEFERQAKGVCMVCEPKPVNANQQSLF